MGFTSDTGQTQAPVNIYLLIGQSNMQGQGSPIDGVLDATHPRVLQWNRGLSVNGAYDYLINVNQWITAQDPLQHKWIAQDKMGMGLSFGKEAVTHIPVEEKIGLVCGADGATGFYSNEWNKGDSHYEDAVAKVNEAIQAGGVLRAILWHQGEKDTETTAAANAYAANLAQMISDLRNDIIGAGPTTPFIAGTLSSAWVAETTDRQTVNNAIIDLPNQVLYTATVDNSSLAVQLDNVHFTDVSLRAMGVNYYTAIASAMANT